MSQTNERRTFRLGDLVMLRSGGPVMTVFDVDEPEQGAVRAEWFDGRELRRDGFAKRELLFIDTSRYEHPKVCIAQS